MYRTLSINFYLIENQRNQQWKLRYNVGVSETPHADNYVKTKITRVILG